MSLRLKALKRNISGAIKHLETRQQFDTIIDSMVELMPSFTDNAIESFIIDNTSKLSSDIDRDAIAGLKSLEKLRDFVRMLASSKVHTIKDIPSTKSLKQLLSDFRAKAEPATDLLAMFSGTLHDYDKMAVKEIEIPDAHVYLNDIKILDDACLGGTGVSINDIFQKFIAIINISPSLIEAAMAADEIEATKLKIHNRQSNAATIEGILNALTGEQSKLHTRRIFKVTRLVRDLVTRVQDAEHKQESLVACLEKPNLYMYAEDQQLTDKAYRERLSQSTSDIDANRKKLNHVLGTFKNAPECSELVETLGKLKKHVDVNIIGALNNAIVRIRATGTMCLVISKHDLSMAIKAGIKLESILATSESPIPDLEAINHRHFKAKEKVSELITGITAKLVKRSIEEEAIDKNGILGALLKILEGYENREGGSSGSGFLCMASLTQDIELYILENINGEIDRLSVLVSERSVDPDSINAMLAALGIDDIEAINVAVLEQHLKSRKVTESILDTIARLMRYTPLGKDAYNAPKIASTKERLARLTANLKMFESVLQVLADIGSKLEDLDPFLPRKYIAMDSVLKPSAFNAILATWRDENMGRLFTTGSAGAREQLVEKMNAIKVKLQSLEGLMTMIPADIIARIKPIAMPGIACKGN